MGTHIYPKKYQLIEAGGEQAILLRALLINNNI
jgi:hypothetical protein